MDDVVTLAQEILAHSERAASVEDGGYIMGAYQSKAAWHLPDIANALIAAHERIKELEAKQQWQPIETAPRDGSHFLALMWHGKAQLVVMASWAKNGVLYDVRETSCVGWDPRWDPRGKTPAPLWLPLPEPPK